MALVGHHQVAYQLTMDSNSAIECHDQSDSCTATALTTGVVSAITTALLVAAVYLSIAIHILIVYQCVYKPKLMKRNASYCTSHNPDAMYMMLLMRGLAMWWG